MSHIDQQPGAHSYECTTCKHDGHDIIEHHATAGER